MKRVWYILILGLLVLTACQTSDSEENPPEQVVDQSFESFDGKTVKYSDFDGQIRIINAWAAWCPFCIDEMPDLQEASNEYDDVVVLFVHRTKTENLERAQMYLDEFPEKRGVSITDPVLKDPEDQFYKEYFGFGMPVTLFVDEKGNVRDRKIGPLTVEEIKEKIETIK